MADERGLAVDMQEYHDAKAAAQQMSQAGTGTGTGGADHDLAWDVHSIAELDGRGLQTTDDSAKYTAFLPEAAVCDHSPVSAEVLAVWTDGGWADEAAPGQRVGLLLDRTSFYAAGGGQGSDTGYMVSEEGDEFLVSHATNYSQCVVPTVLHACIATNPCPCPHAAVAGDRCVAWFEPAWCWAGSAALAH